MPNYGTVHVSLSGVDKLIEVLDSGGEAAKTQVGPALWDVANEVMAEAKRRTPVETGSLRSSGHVSSPMQLVDGWSVKLAFGGAAAPYAIYVHEDLDVHHDAPTGAKFLEGPVKEADGNIADTLADAIETRMML
jgi:hypothetical protein